MSDSYINAEIAEALSDAAYYNTIAENAFYGGSALVAGTPVALALRAGYDLARGTNPYVTPERNPTPPPRATPYKRAKIEPSEPVKMAPMSGRSQYNRTWVRPVGRGYGSRRKGLRKNSQGKLIRMYQGPYYMRQRPAALLPQPETKYVDIASAGTYSGTAWGYVTLCALAQGTGATNRMGNKIFLKRIIIHMRMDCQTTSASTTGPTCRTVLYCNKEAKGALPAAVPSIFATDGITAVRSTPHLPQYDVLRDDMHNFPVYQSSGTTSVQSSRSHTIRWDVPVYKVIDYQSNAGTISDLLKRDYGLALIASAATSCGYVLNAKLLFSDV